MRARAWAAAALLAAAGCAASKGASMTTHEWKGQRGGPAESGAVVAEDAGAWGAAWRRLGQDAPALDFARFVGVVVFAGERPTGGYAVAFDEPQPRGDDLLVRWRVLKPAGLATQAFTQPWKALAVPRPKGRVVLEADPR